MASLKFEYKEGAIVYLITDPDQLKRIVIGYDVRLDQVRYWLRCEVEETLHYSIEISSTPDIVYKTSN